MREVHYRCKRCSNRCHSTYVIDEDGIVVDSWRNRPAFGGYRREKCEKLTVMHGAVLPVHELDVIQLM